MENKKHPLVTVAVITYNSEKYVLETLESVAQQTYKNIELIISDDASTDNTLTICREWLKTNKNLFIRTLLIEVQLNTGVGANSNRATIAAQGKWLKTLAGDDALLPNCIEDNVEYVNRHPDVKVLFSRIEVYKDEFIHSNLLKVTPGVPLSPQSILSLNKSAESQYKMLLLADRIHFTPSVFIDRNAKIAVGGLDERFKILEDYPFWITLTKNGYKLFFMNKITVKYRQHSMAINNTGKNFIVNPNYFKSEEFRKKYTYPHLPIDIRLNQRYQWYISQIYRLDFINKKSSLNRFIYSLLIFYFNPLQLYIKFKIRICRKLKEDEFYK